MRDDLDNEGPDDEGHDGGGAAHAPDPNDGYLRVPHFDARDYDRDAAAVFERLGRPRDAKGYTFADFKDFEFSDADKERRENFRGVAHKLNLTQKQLNGLYDWEVQRANWLARLSHS